MALCKVTGTIYLPDGGLAGDYAIFLQRTNKRVAADYLGSVVPQMVRVLTSQTGTVDFDILTGTYVGYARPSNLPSSAHGYEFAFTVPDAATANFEDCIGAASVPPAPPVWYTQAIAARDEAVAAAASAEASVETVAGVQDDIDQAVIDSGNALSAAAAADGKAVAAQAVIDSQVTPAQLRKNTLDATRAPLPTDDATQGYEVGSRWLWGDDWLLRALPGGGDAGWMPAAVLTPGHFGAVGDGEADDTAAIQAAMDWAARYEQDVTVPLARHIRQGQKYKIDLAGLVYGVSSTLYLKGGVELSGGSLKAISAFPTGGGADSFVLNIGNGRPTVNISVDGGLNPDNSRNANAVRVDGARQGEISVYAIHFPEYGVRVVDAQECRMYLDAKEWLWEEAGRTDSTLRTAIGISIEAHDCAYIEPQASSCMVPLYISGSLNQINGGHFYNGGVADASVDHINVLIETVGAVAADNNIFTSVYSDNGIIKMVDAFANSFIGCLHQKNNDGKQTTRFEVVTTKENTRLNGLVVIGNRFNGAAPEPLRKTTSGVGSFIANTREVWAGNVRSDGASVAGGTKLEGFKIASGTKTQVYGTGVIDILGDDYRQKLHVGSVADGYAVAFPNGSGNAMDWDRALTFNPTGGVRRWFQGPPASGNYVVTKNDLTTLGVGESGVEKLGVASVVATDPAAFTANRHIALKDTNGNTYYVPCRSVPW